MSNQKKLSIQIALIIVLILQGLSFINSTNSCVQETSMNEMNTGEQLPFSLIERDEVQKVSIRFSRVLHQSEIANFNKHGVNFGDSIQHIGPVYLATVTKQSLHWLRNYPAFVNAEPLRNYKQHAPRNVSIPEIYADIAWQMQDLWDRNLTGQGILIANLDTGIQWRHPDFFFADGGNYSWLDVSINWQFDNGTDGIDLNGNYNIESNEKLYAIDTNKNSVFEYDVDWLWLDNGTSTGSIDDGDAFFVVDDINNNDAFDSGDPLIELKTPKTKYIVHKPSSSIQVWDRDVNLTSSTVYDTDGHGTGVAGILNGGQLGYRQFVGVAPDAELMAITVHGSDGLTVEEALIWAHTHGADVILIELGSWTYHYLDGSSNVEVMIDTLTSDGIPVIVPAGNLYGAKRHAKQAITAMVETSTRFSVPTGYGTSEMYITLLSKIPITNAKVNLTEPTSSGTIVHQLSFGSGYWNWQNCVSTSNISVDAFLSSSTQGTYMMAIDISGTIEDTQYWSIDINNTLSGDIHYYISDDISAWSGGVEWVDAIDDHYTITWPSTADFAISVGSYMSRNLWSPGYGIIASYSSEGPRIDGNNKMSIIAPGGWDIVSPWSSDSTWESWMTGQGGLPLYPMFGGFQLFSGTSAAGPHIAGAAALILQLNPDIGSEVKTLIEHSGYNDTYTPPLFSPPAPPDVRFGYGKLNVTKALHDAARIPFIHEVSQNPTAPEYNNTVTVTANVSNADFVLLIWSHDNWTTSHISNMTYSGGVYTYLIPAHEYNTTIDYHVNPINTSSLFNPTLPYSYKVDDTIIPIISSISSNATGTIYEVMAVSVNVSVLEPINASGIEEVILEYTINNWETSTNITMSHISTSIYNGVIPSATTGTIIRYRILAQDVAGNFDNSTEYQYTVEAQTTGTTTTTTATTTTVTSTETTSIGTTTETTTPGTPTVPTTGITELLREYWYFVAIAVVLVFLLCILYRRRG
jgi:subtilisin family serine protease